MKISCRMYKPIFKIKLFKDFKHLYCIANVKMLTKLFGVFWMNGIYEICQWLIDFYIQNHFDQFKYRQAYKLVIKFVAEILTFRPSRYPFLIKLIFLFNHKISAIKKEYFKSKIVVLKNVEASKSEVISLKSKKDLEFVFFFFLSATPSIQWFGKWIILPLRSPVGNQSKVKRAFRVILYILGL